jgi:hypothetical protein
MPIKVDYSPVGGLVSAAGQAGQAEAQQTQFSQGLQMAQLGMQQQAQDRAFDLQQAMAERTLAAQTRTPAADHIAEAASLRKASDAAKQKQYKDQLDSMLADNTIDRPQYQKGLMAVLTGNETLMQHILATPKADNIAARHTEMQGKIKDQLDELLANGFIDEGQHKKASLAALSGDTGLMTQIIAPKPEAVDPMQKPLFRAKIQRIRDQRTMDQQELMETRKALLDPIKTGSVPKGAVEALQKKIAQSFATEDALLSEVPVRAKSAGNTWTPPTTQEATIQSMAQTMAGPNAAKIGRASQQAAGSEGHQELTPDIARQLLQEAGGDKEAARQLARDRGYTF